MRLDELGSDLFLAGTPDDVVSGIRRAVDLTSCEFVQPSFGAAPFDEAMAMLELFGREVLPAFYD
jgi:hypothetical protein